MKIALVDDDEELLSVLSEKLKKLGFGVEVARDGIEALFIIHKYNPDLVLLELILPKGDGFYVLQRVKANPYLRSIPVVVYSTLWEDDHIKKALKLGADDYFVKSQHMVNEVVERVREWLWLLGESE